MTIKDSLSHKRSNPSKILPLSFGARLPLLILLASISWGCGRGLLGEQPSPSPVPPTPVPQPGPPEALVTFHVQLPRNTPLREPIYLNLLDEVTGLALNVKRHEMQAEDDLHYTISLPFPVGSIIKYRYSRQGNYLAQEHTSTKQPVRYRLYQVEGHGTVYDVVSAWSDTSFSGETGRIIGRITNTESSIPISNLLITAGGAQCLTSADGDFLIEGLPPGTHNLVAYSIDGLYKTFMQGAVVEAGSSTPANLELTPAQFVSVVFSVSLPSDTLPTVPVRMAGNIYQLGNTFADLSGGTSTLAARMPVLSPLPDGRHSLAISLPTGADILYKYTLGDGFWNAEHTSSGEFRLRRLIVPDTSTIIEDTIENWGITGSAPLVFDVTVPANTPATDYVSIQFNPFGWTEPVPMWPLGNNRWAYVLYSPLDTLSKLGYRYCRNDLCGSADDATSPGIDHSGRLIEINQETEIRKEVVERWNWLEPSQIPTNVASTIIRPRGKDFFTGVEFQANFHPVWTTRTAVTLAEVHSLGAAWLVLTPTWTYTRQNPPVLETMTGFDPLWNDTTSTVAGARDLGIKVALFPTPRFNQAVDDWWAGSVRDFAWWLVWFDRYRNFILHFADLAEQQGVEALILGGEWIKPAIPGAIMMNGTPSGIPADAEARWKDLLLEIRTRFSGKLAWALPFDKEIGALPPFLNEVDQIYLLWSHPLVEQSGASEQVLHAEAARLLDDEVHPFQEDTGKPVVLGISYPSADGGITGCLADPLAIFEGFCLDPELLSRPHEDIPTIALDLDEQAQVYNALLIAINERDWISGFVSRGFYPPAILQDKSYSVHGKPAGDILKVWFPQLVREPGQ